ncbi:hypothetical protein KKA14_20780 [bacterium]|nr:hypothetical protein [bacterium]
MDPVTNYCEAILGQDKNAKESIRLIPQLSSCSDNLLDLIFKYSKPVNLKYGEELIREGLYDQWVYFIVDGDMEVRIAGQKLGSTGGPIVGERCILGEPRGASLVAGENGLMALGIEMSLIDEINRDINAFSQSATDKKECLRYSDEKLRYALELLLLILNQVIKRVIELNGTCIGLLRKLTDTLIEEVDQNPSGDHQNIQEDSIEIADSDFFKHQSEFFSFLRKAYYTAMKNEGTSKRFRVIPFERWEEIFVFQKDYNLPLVEAFAMLNKRQGIPNSECIELAILAFEITSKYTAEVNKSLNEVLSLYDDEQKKNQALESIENSRETQALLETNVTCLKDRLFDPARAALSSGQTSSARKVMNKLSQHDIDALF